MSNKKDLMTPPELNLEQDKFARQIVLGKDRVTALRTAYPNSNYNDKSAYARASHLLQNPDIVKRIEDLQLVIIERALKKGEYNLEIGTKELMDLLELAKENIATKGLTKTNSDTIIACVQELNKMYKLTGSSGNMSISNKEGGQIMFVNATDVLD